MPSYSMAKSVTSAMIGILVRDGRLDIDEPAAVPEWHEDPDDPRAAITVRHMLHMATGIPWDDGYLNEGSEMYEMVRSDDAAGYAAALHPTADAGERFDYSSGTTTLLARIIGEEVGGDPDDVRAFLHEELFDKIGMTPVEIAFDRAGTWQGSYSADTTAQDYARLGLLYLRGGEWDGEQIVPEQWVEYSRTPSPAEPEYGAHWWLDPRRPRPTTSSSCSSARSPARSPSTTPKPSSTPSPPSERECGVVPWRTTGAGATTGISPTGGMVERRADTGRRLHDH